MWLWRAPNWISHGTVRVFSMYLDIDLDMDMGTWGWTYIDMDMDMDIDMDTWGSDGLGSAPGQMQ